MNNNSEKANSSPGKKILFIGNSYTDQIQDTFKTIVADSTKKKHKLRFVWGGGATLKRLIDNGRAFKWIDKEDWDYVVLQEQSVKPAISGGAEESFYKSVETLVNKIRKNGAEPILYMTWGRVDGFRKREELASFDAMQQKLSKAYREAANRNNIRVAPVGEAWALVRKKDPDLGRELYKKDGSHPSEKGAFIASCVFFRIFFDDSLENLVFPEEMDKKECELIRDVVAGMDFRINVAQASSLRARI